MALSFEDEIRGFLWHGFEQQPTVQRAMSEGRLEATTQESFDWLARMLSNQMRAIFRIAREIDDLRAALGR